MSRREFMERLKALLATVPDGEREEALQYYNDYFDDAGPENEEQVIRELGSPEQVAQKIVAEHSEGVAEYSERGYEDARFRESKEIMSQSRKAQDENAGSAGSQNRPEVQKTTNIWKVIAIVLLCILAAPIIIPLGIVVLVVLIGLVIAAVAVCFGVVVAGVAVLAAGLVVIGVGLAKLFITPAIGLAVAGMGFLMFALGIVLSLVILWCCVKIVPWFIRGIVGLIRYPFRKAGAK